MTTGTRYAIERAILSTYLYNSFALDDEFELIISEPISWKCFKSTVTAKACAKAIHIQQEKDLPFDEFTIVKFMEEKMVVDYDEMIKIQSAKTLSLKSLKYYLALLEDEDKKLKRKNLYKGI